MLRFLTLALLCIGCDTLDRALPDGGIEYRLPDGGWVTDGSGCPCDEIGNTLVIETSRGSRKVLDCMPVYHDDYKVRICFGERCCTWQKAQGAP